MIAFTTPEDTVNEYVEGVLSGTTVAGRFVKLAVQRYVDDMANGHLRGWKFDRDIATRACAFFPLCCRHAIGEWDGEPFELSPSQMFIAWNIFGWKSIETGYRRFSRAYISCGRKWGKTAFLAGVGLFAELADEVDGQPCEPAAEVYIAAFKEDQAKIMYKDAVRMVSASPDLAERLRIQKSKPRLVDKKTDGMIVPLGADKPFSGLNPHCVLLDELHEWKERHRPFLGTITTGGGSRRQPLLVIITTAGDDRSQIWIEEYEHAKKVVEATISGNIIDDREFSFIAEIDDGDDPFAEENWAKANPNYPVTPKLSYLRDKAERAKVMPSAYSEFMRYHCNRQVSSDERVIRLEDWVKGKSPLTITEGQYGHGAFDMGRSDDWAAVSMCFPIYQDGDDGQVVSHYEIKSRSFCCKDGRFKVDQEPFRTWIRDGLMECHSGNQIDFAEVRSLIAKWNDEYAIHTWAHDKTFAGDHGQQLKNDYGIECFAFTQAHNFYNVPMRRFVELVPQGKIVHGGDAVLEWQAGNLEADKNSKDHWMPKKNGRQYKIDGMVATLMAFSEVLYAENNREQGSLYIG